MLVSFFSVRVRVSPFAASILGLRVGDAVPSFASICYTICTHSLTHFRKQLLHNRGLGRVHYVNRGGKPGCDHFGLNYYSRGLMDWKLSAVANPGELMTDMPYALHSEGLFTALKGCSALEVPIYITETGVADKGDDIRPVMIQTYMSAVEQAVRAGFDVRGVLFWSLVDNFEWAFGFSKKFGIFEWHKEDADQRRNLRKSGQLLAHWFERLKNLPSLLQSAD